MTEKPADASGYTPEDLERVRGTCLYVASKLGDLMEDLVIVGGLVPSLLIDQRVLPEGVAPHAGTADLDLGLALAVLNEEHYRKLTERLRAAGLKQDLNEDGKPTAQRWRIGEGPGVPVDFRTPPSREGDRGGRLRNIEKDFAAVITPGLHLAFVDRRRVILEGATILGEQTTRSVYVCGPGAYVVLKALAFRGRGENKDAYDLYYVLRNYGTGTDEVAKQLQELGSDPSIVSALEILKEDFSLQNGVGPRRLADFVFRRPDDRLQTEMVSLVAALLKRIGA